MSIQYNLRACNAGQIQNLPCKIVLGCAHSGKGAAARVGDGGASWRLKALARAKQQASDASDPNFGRRVGDIVSEQWGSLAELTSGLTDSQAAHGTSCVIEPLFSHASLTFMTA